MKNQVHELTAAELIAKYAELKEELFNLRFRAATNQLENPKRLNTAKKDIARVLTEARLKGVDVKTPANKKAKKAKKTVKKTVKTAKTETKVETEKNDK